MTERRREDRLPSRELGLPVGLTSLAPGREPVLGELVNVSAGGMAVWLAKPLEPNSHWLLSAPGFGTPNVPAKLISTKACFGGHVHGFKFSSPQTAWAEKLSRGKAPKA